MPEERKNGRWNGKLTTIVLIVGLLGNAVFFGMKAGETAERLEQVERRQKETEELKARVVRVETMVQTTKENTERIERKLDRLIERRE